jgi:hypothetical protein
LRALLAGVNVWRHSVHRRRRAVMPERPEPRRDGRLFGDAVDQQSAAIAARSRGAMDHDRAAEWIS